MRIIIWLIRAIFWLLACIAIGVYASCQYILTTTKKRSAHGTQHPARRAAH